MWAVFRNNAKMCVFLIHEGADITFEDNSGWNCLDIAIIKMNYESAILLKRRGLVPRDFSMYENNLWQKYDLGMFLEHL